MVAGLLRSVETSRLIVSETRRWGPGGDLPLPISSARILVQPSSSRLDSREGVTTHPDSLPLPPFPKLSNLLLLLSGPSRHTTPFPPFPPAPGVLPLPGSPTS